MNLNITIQDKCWQNTTTAEKKILRQIRQKTLFNLNHEYPVFRNGPMTHQRHTTKPMSCNRL